MSKSQKAKLTSYIYRNSSINIKAGIVQLPIKPAQSKERAFLFFFHKQISEGMFSSN